MEKEVGHRTISYI